MSQAWLREPPHHDAGPPTTNRHRASAPIGRYFGDQSANYVDVARSPPHWLAHGRLRAFPPCAGMVWSWNCLKLGTVGRTTSHHPTIHLLLPSRRRTWLGSTPKGSQPDVLTCSSRWTTFLPATSGTPWKEQVQLKREKRGADHLNTKNNIRNKNKLLMLL